MPSKKTSKPKSPDKLAKTNKSGVELSESHLGQATGGLRNSSDLGKVKIEY